jgi:hypothetical protein
MKKVTSAKEWRSLREEGVVVELPSGFSARLRPVSLKGLVRKGYVPNALLGTVSKVLNLSGDNKFTAQDLKNMLSIQSIICAEAFMEPKIVGEEELDDTSILIDDITEEDANFVYNWCASPQDELAKFSETEDNLSDT